MPLSDFTVAPPTFLQVTSPTPVYLLEIKKRKRLQHGEQRDHAVSEIPPQPNSAAEAAAQQHGVHSGAQVEHLGAAAHLPAQLPQVRLPTEGDGQS